MEILNTTSEWDRVVSINHKAAADAAFEKDLEAVKTVLQAGPGKNRSKLARRYRHSRGEKITCCIMCLIIISAISVLLDLYDLIPNIAFPAVFISLILAGFLIGWNACAAIIGKGK